MFAKEVNYRLAKWILAGMKQDGIINDSEMRQAWKKIAEFYQPPFMEVEDLDGNIGEMEGL